MLLEGIRPSRPQHPRRGSVRRRRHRQSSIPASLPGTSLQERGRDPRPAPTSQSGECCAVEEWNRVGPSAQKPDDAHAFSCIFRGCVVLESTAGFQFDCERKTSWWELLLTCSDTLRSLSLFPCLPRPLRCQIKNDCRCHDQTDDCATKDGSPISRPAGRAS